MEILLLKLYEEYLQKVMRFLKEQVFLKRPTFRYVCAILRASKAYFKFLKINCNK